MPRSYAKYMVVLGLVLLALSLPAVAGEKKFVDTEDYKSGEYDKGIISDYSLLVECGDIEWCYVKKGVKLSEHQIDVNSFKNMSKISTKRMMEVLEEGLTAAFTENKGAKGKVTTENAIYWAERSSEGKRWIPYAGGHLAQAGVGVEMVFKDSKGEIVAMVRHSGREGNDVAYAAEELVDDIADWVHNH